MLPRRDLRRDLIAASARRPGNAWEVRVLSSAAIQASIVSSAVITTAGRRGCRATAVSQALEGDAALAAADSAAVDSTAVAEGGGRQMTGRLITICAAAALACAANSNAQERFDSPEAAAQAVIDAAEAHDQARLTAILGAQAREILTSGNAEQDR